MATSRIALPDVFIDGTAYSSSSVTIAANSAGSLSVPLQKTGYVLVGLAAIAKTGGGNGDCVITAFYPDASSNGIVSVYNMASSSRTIGVTVRGIYKKT